MPTCPHCGREIEAVDPPPVPWWKLDLAPHTVNLGCGSLILIALIVAFCSGGFGASGKIDRLDANIQRLEKSVDELSQAVDRLAKKP